MNKKTLIVIMLAACLAGCAGWGNVTSTLTLPSGEIYTADGKSDEIIEYKNGDMGVSFNRQGRAGIVEQALGAALMNLPDVEIGTD